MFGDSTTARHVASAPAERRSVWIAPGVGSGDLLTVFTFGMPLDPLTPPEAVSIYPAEKPN